MRRYSIILFINEPYDISPLLEGLANQTIPPFEVIVIEECQGETCGIISQYFKDKLNLRYYNKHNSGTGYTRNFAFGEARGDYFIVFDYHCEIPPDYLESVDNSLHDNYLDFFVGNVKSKQRSTIQQVAIGYALNMYYTLEAWKDQNKVYERLHHSPYNLGMSRKVFEVSKGYLLTENGEDMELALRIKKLGFNVGVIKFASVYHSRVKSMEELFYQMYSEGKARINVFRFFPESMKWFHYLPSVFVILCAIFLLGLLISQKLLILIITILISYSLFILVHASIRNKNLIVGVMSIPAVFSALIGYGLGFISEYYKELSGFKSQI